MRQLGEDFHLLSYANLVHIWLAFATLPSLPIHCLSLIFELAICIPILFIFVVLCYFRWIESFELSTRYNLDCIRLSSCSVNALFDFSKAADSNRVQKLILIKHLGPASWRSVGGQLTCNSYNRLS